MSFILKILEKLLDRYIRGGVLVEKPLHRYQFVYRVGMSTETAIFQVIHRLEKSLKHKEIALGAFSEIEGHSTTPPLTQCSGLSGDVDLRPVAGGSGPYLRADSYMPFLVAVVWLPGLLEDARRGEFCLLSCGILWLMSYWSA
jgi:hypothetical protein